MTEAKIAAIVAARARPSVGHGQTRASGGGSKTPLSSRTSIQASRTPIVAPNGKPMPVIASASPRPVRFVMDHRIFRTPILSYVFKHGRAIPIAPAKENPEIMEKAFAEVSAALKAGELVAIFPEGGITRDGELQTFRPGISRILAADPVPVVPMALSGLWGSFFSRVDGAAMKTPFRRGLFSRIGLRVGEAVPASEATPERLQVEVLALRGELR